VSPANLHGKINNLIPSSISAPRAPEPGSRIQHPGSRILDPEIELVIQLFILVFQLAGGRLRGGNISP